ncbi:MoaD/ThiS family protein [Desulfovermiculus halophilus]|jgi:molybdopterin converting factor small subunit|uniref:MoaD/ThiS family protein n=1 Tax=Desulfovermiculus halophilus TaxID=339722 RepID=UPI00048920B4|nr:MoaD/ThiS family protein [Desulfovermiculus halophilus]
MKIQIRCYATLARYQPSSGEELQVQPGVTGTDVAARLGIGLEEIKVAFVNGRHAPLETELQDGDRVALFPAVGGG